jgi:dephospho-CoA kinase
MNKLIIGLVGPIASGKGETKKYLQEKYGATEHRFSTMLRDVLNRMHIEISRKNLQDVSLIMRQQFGSDLLAKVLTEDVKNDNHELIVIDGIRRAVDIQYLKEIPGFNLVSIDANERLRYERVVSRNENAGDNEKSFAEFQKDTQAEAELAIPEVMATAKIQIENNGTFEDLYLNIDKLLSDLRR